VEERIGIIGIIIYDFSKVDIISSIIHQYSNFIIGRQGLNLKEDNLRVISLIVKMNTDQFGAFTGKLGKIKGVQVKSILSIKKEDRNDSGSEH
jgi:putative iron-only hydrogenase system regulator